MAGCEEVNSGHLHESVAGQGELLAPDDAEVAKAASAATVTW